MARSIVMFALLAALFAVFALSAQAVEDLPCPAFRKCAPKADRFGFRRATDKPGTQISVVVVDHPVGNPRTCVHIPRHTDDI